MIIIKKLKEKSSSLTEKEHNQLFEFLPCDIREPNSDQLKLTTHIKQ